MEKVRWVKQLTRENTLLDRSLRSIAYAKSVPEAGKAVMKKCPVVGRGKITTWYYDPVDYRHQQTIILHEFKGKRIAEMGNIIIQLLSDGYYWALAQRKVKISRTSFPAYLKSFNLHHAHGRGAIVYGYWGEPAVTTKLRKMLRHKVPAKDMDKTLSTLSAPRKVFDPLKKLYSPSQKIWSERKALIKKLRLNSREVELVEILSWFTTFYELGEQVSSLLFDELLIKLRQIVPTKEFDKLMWYDPKSLMEYFKGKKLSDRELRTRHFAYVLLTEGTLLRVISGAAAITYIRKNFEPFDTAHIKTNELRGAVASTGTAIGRVKIVITQEDQFKMRKGEILVSTMTTPRLMSAVHKAAAIVTDEGGLTAHAAIISRELGIPCIIGTKIATQIFKDGELDTTRQAGGLMSRSASKALETIRS